MKINAIPLSQLPDIDDPSGMFVFASKTEPNGELFSGKYSLDSFISEMAQKLQLERRLSYTFEKLGAVKVFTDEPMTIYRIATKNISEVFIEIDGIEQEFDTDTELNITVPAGSVIGIGVNKAKDIDVKEMYVFIYAKAKLS